MMGRTVSILSIVVLLGLCANIQRAGLAAVSTPADALRALDEVSAGMAELDKIYARTVQLNEGMSKLYSGLNKGVDDFVRKISNPNEHLSKSVVSSTVSFKDMQAGLSMQYLALQDAMQNANRQYTLVSNLVKTKHDAAKNTISNIR